MARRRRQLDGKHPLFELECGRITEERFLDILRDGLEPELGHRPTLHRFKEIYFEALQPNRADDRADGRAARPRATGWRC